jgi:glutamine cyclotransferase
MSIKKQENMQQRIQNKGLEKGLKFHGLVLLLASLVLSVSQIQAAGDIPVYGIEIVNTWPHDPAAFTQGLTWYDDMLYEGTGRNGQSSLRMVDLESGELLKRENLNSRYFGEGIAIHEGKIYQLTWRSHIGFVYDLESFKQEKTFFLAGEGWGITNNEDSLIVSDGSANLRFLDPDTLQEKSRVEVTLSGRPVQNINELEFINGEIWANLWYQDVILRIDPETGYVTSIVDLNGLYPQRNSRDEVLNGIAWDEAGQRLFVTGKLWSALYEIKVLE